MNKSLPLVSLCLTLAACGEPQPTRVEDQTASAQASAVPGKSATAMSSVEPKAQAKQPPRGTKRAERQTFKFQLDRSLKSIAGKKERAEKHPDSPSNWTALAGQHMSHARLTGSYDDYASAETYLAKSSGKRRGFEPYLQRAKLKYTLHQLDRIDDDLRTAAKRTVPKPKKLAALHAFEANVAFQRGQYSQAQQLFVKSLGLERGMGNCSSYAVYHWKTGDFETAEKLFNEALTYYHGKPTEPVAWVHLQFGLMDLDRGRWDDALAHYRTAEALIVGYWLVDEHIAEILTLQGKTDEAKRLYLDIIERTDSPEFLDAMAGIYREAGDEQAAQGYIKRARTRYAAQLKRFPEAAYGHALGHFLEFGEDPARTLKLAQANHSLRPNGEAKTLLAQAYLAVKRPEDAKKVIEEVLKSAFDSAELHATAAEVFAELGDKKLAKSELDKAKAIDPSSGI